MIEVVCWKWRPAKGYRSTFTAQHVNTFARMVGRHYAKPHRVTCITDDPAGIDPAIRVIPLWDDFANLRSPHDTQTRRPNPSCYRRLKMFAPDAGEWLGRRIISLDLDVVVTGDLAPLFDRKESIVLWGDSNPTTHYNGGMILFTAGCRPELWTEFDPVESPRMATRLKQFGSDQAWISARLGPGEARFRASDGVHSYRNEIRPHGGRLPANARLVFFHGEHDPWGPEPQRLDWVRGNWK